MILSQDQTKALKRLDKLRLKNRSTKQDQEFHRLIAKLADEKVYVETLYAHHFQQHSFQTMVENWGAYWFEYKGIQKCPKCGSDLCNREYGPPFKREIMFNHFEEDYFTIHCPDCNQQIK